MTEEAVAERYEPYTEEALRFYPGSRLTPERRRLLDEDAIDGAQLTTDDIAYKLSRLVTGTMYTIIAEIEDRWGKEAAREVIWEWGHKRARVLLSRWMQARNVSEMTPELWASYQDYRHLISGPTHSPSTIHYEGEHELVLERRTCIFHSGRPEGMDSYCGVSADGMFVGYAEVCPAIRFSHQPCMSRGTSDDYCVVRFHFEP